MGTGCRPQRDAPLAGVLLLSAWASLRAAPARAASPEAPSSAAPWRKARVGAPTASTTTDNFTASATSASTASAPLWGGQAPPGLTVVELPDRRLTLSNYNDGYSLLPAGLTCYEVGLPDVPSSTDCQNLAMVAAGLSDKTFTGIPANLGFSCVYNDVTDGGVLYSTTTGAATQANSDYRYI
ncbi:unnamed protein product [Prorocentrum cordatum]|uniref:Subtilisin n=1 Tax=Prorocentrum cordatum TaxID=2364126 RepID=A0ABN9XS33_9DINO|nr:unnamed protein product [Polarella glacialis]